MNLHKDMGVFQDLATVTAESIGIPMLAVLSVLFWTKLCR